MKFSTNRRTKRLPCYQPIQMFVLQQNCTPACMVINGIITNATKNGLFIQTSSKIENGKIFFNYKDAKSDSILYFECDVIRKDQNGIAVTYQLLTDSDQGQANCQDEEGFFQISKGRFLDCYI